MRIEKYIILEVVMKFIELDDQYLDACVDIAMEQYSRAQSSVYGLYLKDYKKEIFQYLKNSFGNHNGIMAFEKNKLVGYLAFGETWGGQLNTLKEISSPLWGYGISEGYNRGKMASLLFQHASEILCKNSVGNFNITVYASDYEVIKSYVLNNFGILCTDAIRMIDMPICQEPEGEYTYKELTKKEIDIKVDYLLELWRELVQHLRMSPTYYPGEEFTDRVFLDHIHNDGTRLFVVEENEKIIGMIDVSKDSNSFITKEEDTMNVGDLYIKQNYRGYHIAAGLLLHVNNILKKEGVKRLWVEHGTTNPTAQRFWGKYFDSFTYTLTRKIDERIII